jgi:phage host-nuclease inhibitor protein Gam
MSEPVLKLYEISAEYDRVAEAIIENGGELTPELEAELEKIEGAFEEKAERVALYIRNLLATADTYTREALRIAQKSKSLQNTADSLKAYLKRNMEKLELTKVEGKLATVAIQKNSQPSVAGVTDAMLLQMQHHQVFQDFVKITRSADKGAIARFAAAGGELPEGVEVTRGSHVRIR